MEQPSWDPEVKRHFVRIINTISMGLIWLLAAITAGLYFKLAYPGDHLLIFTFVYWVLFVASLALLIRYLIRLWRNP
ncbi:MAG: hypothetical protein ACK4E0_07675 [Chitinophagaceae bacterium]